MYTKTIEECQLFLEVSSKREEKETKLSYAIKKVRKSIEIIFKKYNQDIEDARIEECSVDEKGNVIRDSSGQYVFSKDALKRLVKKQRDLFEHKYPVESFIVSDLTGIELTDQEKEVFCGFVLDPEKEKFDK